MCEDIKALREKVDAMQADLDKQFSIIAEAQRQNAEAIANLTASTEGVVSLYNDLGAAARVGLGLQRFTVSLSKFGFAGAVLAGFTAFILENYAP